MHLTQSCRNGAKPLRRSLQRSNVSSDGTLRGVLRLGLLWRVGADKLVLSSATRQTRDLEGPYEILVSVFGPMEKPSKPYARYPIKTLDDRPEPFTHEEFVEVAEDVKSAIRQGVQPKLNKAGSSGSYFARSTSGKTVGIFKPKGRCTLFQSMQSMKPS